MMGLVIATVPITHRIGIVEAAIVFVAAATWCEQVWPSPADHAVALASDVSHITLRLMLAEIPLLFARIDIAVIRLNTIDVATHVHTTFRFVLRLCIQAD